MNFISAMHRAFDGKKVAMLEWELTESDMKWVEVPEGAQTPWMYRKSAVGEFSRPYAPTLKEIDAMDWEILK